MLDVLQPQGAYMRNLKVHDERMIDSDAEYEAERSRLLAQRELLQKQWMEELELQKRLLQEYQQQNRIQTERFAAPLETDTGVDEEIEPQNGETPSTRECLQLSLVICSHFLKIFSAFVLLFAVVFTSIFGCCAVSASQLLLVSSALPLFFYFRGKGQG